MRNITLSPKIKAKLRVSMVRRLFFRSIWEIFHFIPTVGVSFPTTDLIILHSSF